VIIIEDDCPKTSSASQITTKLGSEINELKRQFAANNVKLSVTKENEYFFICK
jgi:hypothetical protein